MSEVQEIAKARDKWLSSLEGKNCLSGHAYGQYLRNRLARAFSSGYQAALDRKKG